MGLSSISGVISSAFICKPIPEVSIKLYNTDNRNSATFKSDNEGRYQFDSEKVHRVVFEKTGFIKKEIIVGKSFPKIIRLLEDEIIGYQDRHSFKPGEEITAFISSRDNYKAELLRNGLKVENVMQIGSFKAILQEVPDRFFVDTGLEWQPAFRYRLPEDLDSGLYTLKVTSLTNPKNFYNLSFVVSPKPKDYGKKTKVLVLASTNNWQTYNIWGGRSRYRNFESAPSDSSVKQYVRYIGIKFLPESIKKRLREVIKKNIIISIKDHPDAVQFKKLSIKRPHPNCSINSTDPNQQFTSHLAEGEWRILAWLERENYSYDMISGFELHNNPELLQEYDTLILSTHSEYWSKEMFAGLKSFFNNGGNILNLSGNSIYREIEYFEDGSLRCISLKFGETTDDETQVIGVRFDMSGYGTCASYKVLDPNHWTFKNTNLKLNENFGLKCLNNQMDNLHPDFIKDPASRPGMARLKGKGGSGWETDKLSSTAPADIKLVAKGTNKFKGGADMIVRDSDGQHGLLFSASSITFGGTLLVDDNCSTIVKNVIEKVKVKEFQT